jgi:hypothetical protein
MASWGLHPLVIPPTARKGAPTSDPSNLIQEMLNLLGDGGM